MNPALVELFRYNRWANLALIEACRGLDDATLDGRPTGPSGSVRELFLHIAGAQQSYAERASQQHVRWEVKYRRESDWPGFETVESVLRETSEQLLTLAEGFGADPDIEFQFLGKAQRYPQHFFLMEAIVHGMEHRTDIKASLAQRGIDTPDLDGWVYAWQNHVGGEV